MALKIGLCGFSMAIGRYPLHFTTVEIQQSFYEPPSETVVRRWRASVPADFEFTIKAWQLITHTSKSPTYRRLRRSLTPRESDTAGAFSNSAIVHEAWESTLKVAEALEATAVLFQCPASFRPTDENVTAMTTFFRRIRRPARMRLLWEPRGIWEPKLVASICATNNLIHVVDPFVTPSVTKGFTYYRLHGISGSRHVFTDAELLRLRDMLPDRGPRYVFFNNIPRVNDALRFTRLMAVGGAGRTR